MTSQKLLQDASEADDAYLKPIHSKQQPGIDMDKTVQLDIAESCVELVQRFQDLDRRVNNMVFSSPGYDHEVLEALEIERAHVVNLTMFHLGVALRGCGYELKAGGSRVLDESATESMVKRNDG